MYACEKLIAQCMMQLERERDEFNETLRRQQQYQQSVHDISDRLDQLRSGLDALRLHVQLSLTDSEIDDKLHAAEVSHLFTSAMG